MKVVVTGSRGKVGRAATQALVDAGHDVLGVDLVPPVFDAGVVVPGRYKQADLTDAGSAFAIVAGVDAVVHSAWALIPDREPEVLLDDRYHAGTYGIPDESTLDAMRAGTADPDTPEGLARAVVAAERFAAACAANTGPRISIIRWK